jgi:hypothetical protein
MIEWIHFLPEMKWNETNNVKSHESEMKHDMGWTEMKWSEVKWHEYEWVSEW